MFNQYGGSRADTLVKLVLIFFISLLSFSIGTFVGKQFSDSQHRKIANDGEADEAVRDTASIDPKSLDVAPQDALTEEDLANLDDEFVNTKKDDLAKVADDAHKKTAKVETVKTVAKNDHGVQPKTGDTGLTKSLEAVHKVAQRVADSKPPTEKKTEITQRIPSSMPVRAAADSVGKYTVQISSYNNEDEAARYAKELVNKGFSAFYLAADVNGKTWYRVGIGLHGSLAEAKKAREDLLKQPDIKTAIVQKVTNQTAKAQN
ncbi:MAG: SPOR domain-containing protein [Bdellovibrionia bacterium]